METKIRKGRKPANKTAYRAADAPKLTALPQDYDPAKHTPLTEDDFADEVQYLYWDARATVYRERLAEAVQQADLCRRFGSREQRAKIAQLAKLTAHLEKLKAELGDLS